MTAIRIIAIVLAALAIGCDDCEDRPDTWRGAALTGCSSAGSSTCCSYSGPSCSYVVCQDGCSGWEQQGWSCW